MLRVCAPLLFAASALPWIRSDCSATSVGFTPLMDLTGSYQGKPGGLYPGGNAMPPVHLAKGLAEIANIVPRDASGAPSPSGKIGLVTIGMSNTTIESMAFLPLANASSAKHPDVVLVNGAKTGNDAPAIGFAGSSYWPYVDSQIAAAGLTKLQVQAVWLKEAIIEVALPFPQDSNLLNFWLRNIVVILKQRFPNVRACYVSSRSYGGYSTIALSPEPYAYQTAFAVKDLVEAQINGDPSLNFDPSQGPVRAMWLAWGPYFWADGLVPRSDGLTWSCSDFFDDGVHPSPQGAQKAAQMLLDFFVNDATTAPWFDRCPSAATSANFGSGLAGAAGVPTIASFAPPKLGAPLLALEARGAPPSATVFFAVGTTGYPDGALAFAGGWVHTSLELLVPIPADAIGNAFLPLGPIPDVPVLCGAHLFAQVGTADATAPQGFGLSPGLDLTIGH